MKVLLYSLFILVGTFISSIAQVMLKKSAQKTYENKIAEYLNPLVIIGYAIFFSATFLSILAYKEVPLSMGPVLESTSYIYVTIFGVKIFHEKFNKLKVLALCMIVGGIAIYAFF